MASGSEQLRPLIHKLELTFGGLFALALFRPGTTGQQDILERTGAIGQRRCKLPERSHRLARRHTGLGESGVPTPFKIGIETYVDLSGCCGHDPSLIFQNYHKTLW